MLSVYYDDGTATILHGDAHEFMAGGCDFATCNLAAPDGRIFCPVHHDDDGDPAVALVTDPPYGIGYRPGGESSGKGRNGPAVRRVRNTVAGDHQPFTPDPWLRFPEVILWGANHYADSLPASPSWLVWDKRCGTPSDSHADCEMAWTNLGGPARLHAQLWRGMIREGEPNSVPRIHPTQKPEALMRWCIGMTKAPVIFDPFMGSGTTVRAAKDLGRRVIGIEVEEAYCEAAAKRLTQEVLNVAV